MKIGDLVQYNEKTISRHVKNVMMVVDIDLDHRQTSVSLMMANGRFVDHVWPQHPKVISDLPLEKKT